MRQQGRRRAGWVEGNRREERAPLKGEGGGKVRTCVATLPRRFVPFVIISSSENVLLLRGRKKKEKRRTKGTKDALEQS
jgi:hypothetical protein